MNYENPRNTKKTKGYAFTIISSFMIGCSIGLLCSLKWYDPDPKEYNSTTTTRDTGERMNYKYLWPAREFKSKKSRGEPRTTETTRIRQPISNRDIWDQETDKRWTQPVLKTPEPVLTPPETHNVAKTPTTNDKDLLLARTEQLWIPNMEWAYHLWKSCEATAIDKTKCYKYWIAVATAESGLFKKMRGNNWFGVMKWWKIQHFASVEDGIDRRLLSYNKYRYTNKTPSQWINRSHYCTSSCTYRVGNVQSTLNKLNWV